MDIYQILLQQEAIRGERTAWIFRWVLYGLVFCLAAAVYFFQGRVVGFYGMLLSGTTLLYNAGLSWFIVRKCEYHWIRYVSVTMDVAALTTYNVLDTIYNSPLVPVTTAALLIYPVVLFLAALRLDRRLILYATLLSALATNLLFAFAYPHFDPVIAAQLVSADIPGQVYRTAYLLLCGFLMFFVPGTVTRLLMNQQEIYNKSRANYELAHRDMLTGLANRRRLEDYLPQEIARAGRESTRLGVLYMDLDGFKPINDELGHDAGDLVLQEVGRRLNAVVRGYDLAVRMGGDEFVVILSRVENEENCRLLAERIRSTIMQDIQINENAVQIGVSIGYAIFPDHGLSQDELFEAADKAMLQQKRDKRRNLDGGVEASSGPEHA